MNRPGLAAHTAGPGHEAMSKSDSASSGTRTTATASI
jgi:hypothetical protein